MFYAKDPSLTTMVVPWEKRLAIAFYLLLEIQKLLRRIVGYKLTNLKPSQIQFYLDRSLKSEKRS